jgi:hypothetical protein
MAREPGSRDGRQRDRALAAEVAREASAELARLRRIRGASRRTARRIARARARLGVAAALLAAPLAEPALARPPSFRNPLAPFGPASVGYVAAPRFADLDGDGDLDALVGSVLGETLFFPNTGTSSAPAFAAPVANEFGLVAVGQYASPALVDIDGDGDLDVFVGSLTGVTSFFENTGTASAPAFDAPHTTSPFSLAALGGYATPTFADLDLDGDFDALVGDVDGETFFFENTGTPTAPVFGPPAASPFGLTDVGGYSSPTLGDLDGDGDLDAVVGGLDGGSSFFENTGSASAPAFAPPVTMPFGLGDVGYLASPDLADIDGDGDLDAFLGEGFGVTIFFANTGSASAPAFLAPDRGPLGAVDLNYLAAPAFGDLDGDGDLDALLGALDGNAHFFANTGTANGPAFAAAALNSFGLEDVGSFASPAIGDLDGDGDLDVLVGEDYGSLVFFDNTGSASAPAFAPPLANPFGLADLGDLSAPALADLDGDGDLDVVAGEEGGSSVFFGNTGSAVAPAFAAASTGAFGLDEVLMRAAPEFADLDRDGDLDAFIGESPGNVVFYANTGSPSLPGFALAGWNPFGLGAVGVNVSPAFADLDGDGDLDAHLGLQPGTLVTFENLQALCPGAPDPGCPAQFARGSLSVNERKPGREKLVARLSMGPALAQPDFGDPTVVPGTAVGLCLYDGAGERVAALEVDRAAESCGASVCWKPIGGLPPDGRGFAYRDPAASSGGVRSMQWKGGAAGRSRLAVTASNKQAVGQTALPTGITAALVATAEVTVQLHTSEGACFEATLSDVRKQRGDFFKAR